MALSFIDRRAPWPADRFSARHLGLADTQDASSATHARLGHRPTHPSSSKDVLQVNQGALYPALHRTRTTGVDSRQMGRIGKQSPRQVLFTHARRR